MSMAASMLAELRGLERVHAVLELTLSGTVYKFAAASVASASQGNYLSRVLRWGNINHSINLRGYSLTNPRITVTLKDEDRVLQKEIGGPSSGAVIGAVVKIILRSNYVALADHFTVFDGVVADYRLSGDHVYEFVFTPDDQSLVADTNEIPTITRADWFRAPSVALGLDGQAVYGNHKSTGSGTSGAVTCIPVHTYHNWWYVSIGTVYAVTNVWRSGTLATSDFTLTTVDYNGRTYSLIKDDTATSDQESDEITVDVEGIEDVNGEMEEDPVNVLSDFFDNYTSVTLDSTIMAEAQTFLTRQNQKCAKVIKSSDSPSSVFSGLCNTYKVFPFWSLSWKLAVRPYTHAPATVYVDSRHIKQDKVLGDLRFGTDRKNIVSRIIVNRVLLDSTGSYVYTNYIEDPDRNLIVETDSFEYGEVRP